MSERRFVTIGAVIASELAADYRLVLTARPHEAPALTRRLGRHGLTLR